MSRFRCPEPPVAIDLYSGAGGLSEGFLNAGFAVRFAVDKDKWATETQRTNHASRGVEVITADLTSPATFRLIQERVLALGRALWVLMGGPPCQGFSTANVQTRVRGNPHNSHIYTFLRYVRRLAPPIFLMENVPGLQLFNGGRLLRNILGVLRDAGYHVDLAVLNAADYGVPQMRQRFFLIGNRLGVVNYFAPPKLSPPQWVSVGEAIADLPSLLPGSRDCSMPYAAKRPSAYARQMRINGSAHVSNNSVSKNSDLILKRYRHIPQGGNWQDIPSRLMRNYTDKTRCHKVIYQRLAANKPAPVIANVRKSMLIHPFEHRGLSVREAARLQSFPDSFAFKGGIEAQQQQVANSVPPLLAADLASTILNKMIRTSTPVSAVSGMVPDRFEGGRQRRQVGRRAGRHFSYFRARLSRWASNNLRALPWRKATDAYHILLAEVLLQKTTAAQASDAYLKLVERYPTPETLARADPRTLTRIIAPIGLPNRADRLRAIAKTIVRGYHGFVPRNRKELAALPGVGPYIAAAVACFAFGEAVPLVDSNILRIFKRFFGLTSKASRPRDDPAMWRFAAELVPKQGPGKYHKALVDLGALVCTHHKPKCDICPVRARCAFRNKE